MEAGEQDQANVYVHVIGLAMDEARQTEKFQKALKIPSSQ